MGRGSGGEVMQAKNVIFFNRNMIKSYERTWGRWAMADGRGHRTPLALSSTPPAAAAGEALTRKGAYVQRCVCVWMNNESLRDWLADWLTDKMNALRLFDDSISWIMTATNSANCKCSIQFDYDGKGGKERERERWGQEQKQDECVRVHCALDWVPCPGIWVAFECQASVNEQLWMRMRM